VIDRGGIGTTEATMAGYVVKDATEAEIEALRLGGYLPTTDD